MSNKSGVSEQVISVPKAGGALKGIGEKFSPDLHTGTGNFSVPISLPPGRNGFQPQLSLVYSTGNGNGPFGLGWSISVPGVSRKTSKGVPRYDDARDTFVLSGVEDLVPVSSEPTGVTRYRPRTEGIFARIERTLRSTDDYWEVRTRDGLVSCYGTARPSGAGAEWQDPAAIADPNDASKVFAWKLSLTTDPFGNRIEYLYEREPVREMGPHHWDQLYLSEIRYADWGDDPTALQYLVTVRFIYEDRPDPFSEHRSGFEIRTTRRCTDIEVHTHPGSDIHVRSYHLFYQDRRPLPPSPYPHNGVSLLSQVIVEGYDGPESEQLPPLEFNYTGFMPSRRDLITITGPGLPPGSLARPEYEQADLMGSGLPGILEMSGTVRYWQNLGNGRFDLSRELRESPAGLALADPGVQMIDANGDGRLDLLVQNEILSGYFPTCFGASWDRRSFQPYRVAPSFRFDDPEVKLVDLDGDGVTDVIRSSTRMECYFNDPQQGWVESRWVERQAIEVFPNVNFSDPRVKWGDMTGDGLQDILLVHDGNVEYWANMGYGNWEQRISMRNSPRFPYGYDPRRILVGDVDGDGLADIVYVDDRRVLLWINQSGNAWSDCFEIDGTPPVSDVDAVRLVDQLGAGISGVLWSRDADVLTRDNLFFLDFTGGLKPYLLHEMDNHMGARTLVAYSPSTRFYLEDERWRDTRWKTNLPFPVQVVAMVEVIDEISGNKLTTEYRYHHGYWDGTEREFRGFGRVDQRDTEIFESYNGAGMHGEQPFEHVELRSFSPFLETRTWFHQGPVGDVFGEWEEVDYSAEFWSGDVPALTRPPEMEAFLGALPRSARRDALRTLRGQVLRTELYALDGTERENRPYTVTESLSGVREESPPGAGDEERQRIFFAFPLASRTTQWERGDDPLTQFSFSGDYDHYGLPLSSMSIAVSRGRDFRVSAPSGEPYLATRSMTSYAQRDDAECYVVDRTARATGYEILNDGSQSVFALKSAAEDGSAGSRVIGQTLNFYDGDAFVGLPNGEIGSFGAITRTETLILTDEILHAAYDEAPGSGIPPYLIPGGTPSWTAEYPEEFRESVPPLAGYVYHAGGDGVESGYFVTTSQAYDFQVGSSRRGLVLTQRDPLGRDTHIGYDTYKLLPVSSTDPVGLRMAAEYDYRVFQPVMVTDSNDNRQRFGFTPLGLVSWTAVMGKAEELSGDTLEVPGTRLTYDFLTFDRSPVEARQPIWVRSTQRVHHANDSDIPLTEREETIEKVEYSDGFGRVIQTRTQAEDILFGDPVFGGEVLPADQSTRPGDAVGRRRGVDEPSNVVVSGWQAYDNKGRPVTKWEPFFSQGWEFARPGDAETGQRVELFYDPRGQTIRTLNPDGSEVRVIYGVPADLDDPEIFTPTPWEAYTYDANDNAGRTHSTLAGGYAHHWNTPSNIRIDALGRTVESVERNREAPAEPTDRLPALAAYHTYSTYDIRGNLLRVTDPQGRLAFQYVVDLTPGKEGGGGRVLRTDNIDAGSKTNVLDAAGNFLERRDAKGSLALAAYDLLSRPSRLWARNNSEGQVTLRERLEYGDGGLPDQPAAEREAQRRVNRLGKIHRHYDEAGLLEFYSYDFKGNLLEKTRRVIADEAILRSLDAATRTFQVDWKPPGGTTIEGHAASLLEPDERTTASQYDALNRATLLRYPQDVTGERKVLAPRYNRAGALEAVELDGQPYVRHISYNAKGQRTLIAYGNDVLTRCAYDPQTFRLARLHSQRFHADPSDEHIYRAYEAPLQDLGYEYDLSGNLLLLRDRTPESGIRDSLLGLNALDREFKYDPLYRLLSATGRECNLPPVSFPPEDVPRCVDLMSTHFYSEEYMYDDTGNLLCLRHTGDDICTRRFTLVLGTNRLATVRVGGLDYGYTYDASGNLVQETTSRHFEWDYADQLIGFRNQTEGAEPTLSAIYLYDSTGQRVKKLVRKGLGRVETSIYIDGIFEHHSHNVTGTVSENNTLHVMDNAGRIALVRAGEPFPGDGGPAVQYHLGDHLGSSSLVVDETGSGMNREEFTPYGETSFGSFARKRYRFTGKEHDEEIKFYYFGARYYSAFIGRWTSPDPLGVIEGLNTFLFAKANPVSYIDLTGLQVIFTGGDIQNAHDPQAATLVVGNQEAREMGWRDFISGFNPNEQAFFQLQVLPDESGQVTLTQAGQDALAACNGGAGQCGINEHVLRWLEAVNDQQRTLLIMPAPVFEEMQPGLEWITQIVTRHNPDRHAMHIEVNRFGQEFPREWLGFDVLGRTHPMSRNSQVAAAVYATRRTGHALAGELQTTWDSRQRGRDLSGRLSGDTLEQWVDREGAVSLHHEALWHGIMRIFNHAGGYDDWIERRVRQRWIENHQIAP